VSIVTIGNVDDDPSEKGYETTGPVRRTEPKTMIPRRRGMRLPTTFFGFVFEPGSTVPADERDQSLGS
jgi:hypothetical protein